MILQHLMYQPTYMLYKTEYYMLGSVMMHQHMWLHRLLVQDWYRYESDSVYRLHNLRYMLTTLTTLTIIS
jgi:hypothetical protein